MDFRNKRVLVMGLGLLRGGASAAKWVVNHGARVTVTDLKPRRELQRSLKSLGEARRKIKFVFGRHRVSDFRNNEIIVVNPAVPRETLYLKIAKKAGAQLENEASIFFRFCRNPMVGVTGTRGKTTTANWIYHFLKKKYSHAALTGNSSDNPMLAALDKLDSKSPVVVELSSWHLELLPQSGKSPHVAVITNLYPDHLNRYPSMKSYASAKANIFLNQSKNDFLLLNKDNSWTKFFRGFKPKGKIVYFPVSLGLNLEKFKRAYGLHNFYNLNVAILVARHFGITLQEIKKAIKNLPQIRFRQEIILKRKNLEIINDTTATTPEATIAALGRFRNTGELFLITGGTDKKLGFTEWARTVKKCVKPGNLFLLNGSATKKMVLALKKAGYFRKIKPYIFENLSVLIKAVKVNLKPKTYNLSTTILFSPGATSFEKFKNEFDRGERFNRLVKLHF
ncbi:MAG: UDP-N-acetylmuramoylalanine-D-glutamate ligase [Candidatus Jorgensenbacteria bacterium GW2011_GWA1_48_13]|uniref:UDP-N-acetylmuramoylalanine-D-glutamate ligase n=1 Tax=Candidatus Jorgensenbacteria bacterium GW2011_GWB1_50_10 TaxID=1618665 RepID=A0A0G1YIH9_9BACT|nr:MAG: UDP-N-acetylmuramoylalanine-D-glutamate ligase [Candidatus Jorgensenbacteria bacterium GW2011_GWA1_48_13]KKW14767.1 MAG: UDP-N-acetylmuramoylalanine-D-glutamate ligase [Candidatus Jorgensenbacteria bacterium GW2011_GWB1_50_10]